MSAPGGIEEVVVQRATHNTPDQVRSTRSHSFSCSAIPATPATDPGCWSCSSCPSMRPPDETRRLGYDLNRTETELTGWPNSAPGAVTRARHDPRPRHVPSALHDPGLIDTLLFYTSLLHLVRNGWLRDRLT